MDRGARMFDGRLREVVLCVYCGVKMFVFHF